MKIDLNSNLSLDALTDRVRLMDSRYDALRAQEPLQLPGWAYPRVKSDIEAGRYGYENDPLWEEPKN